MYFNMGIDSIDNNLYSIKSKCFICPFCGYSGELDLMGADRFPVLQKLHVIGAGRRAARCPKCSSTDKERLVYTYLKEVEKIQNRNNISVLHIAPENNLQLWLGSVINNYIPGDAFLQNQKFIGEIRFIDIKKTEFADNQFDYIICNHVLCDIKDVDVALHEIYRILKIGGLAILQVPITKISSTVEYQNVHTKEERELAYGYGYHERIYNNIDYINTLSSVDFMVNVRNISKQYIQNGLNPEEDLYLCKKS
jgi:hypothetical protein